MPITPEMIQTKGQAVVEIIEPLVKLTPFAWDDPVPDWIRRGLADDNAVSILSFVLTYIESKFKAGEALTAAEVIAAKQFFASIPQ